MMAVRIIDVTKNCKVIKLEPCMALPNILYSNPIYAWNVILIHIPSMLHDG